MSIENELINGYIVFKLRNLLPIDYLAYKE